VSGVRSLAAGAHRGSDRHDSCHPLMIQNFCCIVYNRFAFVLRR
jgi:hypothetical protein